MASTLQALTKSVELIEALEPVEEEIRSIQVKAVAEELAMKEDLARVKLEMRKAKADLDKELAEKRKQFEAEIAQREAEITKKESWWKEREEMVAKYSCQSEDMIQICTDNGKLTSTTKETLMKIPDSSLSIVFSGVHQDKNEEPIQIDRS
mmetsp:Transcript_20348/g.31078  ORF Transcript_20348/g.31078 Transcript_20348/m.31078 type:complete len:151 (+) Transcript_20348:79-531(+)